MNVVDLYRINRNINTLSIRKLYHSDRALYCNKIKIQEKKIIKK